MSTLKTVNVIHPSGVTNNIVNDASGNVTVGNNFTITGTLTGSTGVMNIGSGQIYKDSSGNVGVGTSTPGTRLDAAVSNPTRGLIARLQNPSVSGQTGSQLWFNQSGIANWVIGQPASTDAFAIWSSRTDVADGTERMRIDASGNVGIGGTPANGMLELFKTSGEAVLRINNTAGSSWVTFNPSIAAYLHNITNTPMVFTTNGTERMRIGSSGNVAVGASAQIQSEKLGVTAGTANATQYQTISTVGGSTLLVNQQQTTSVSTTATTILNGPQYMNFCLVYGVSGSNRFADVVLMSVGTGTVNVISSLTASGTPAARTYSQSSSTFRLAMASGTYTVQVTCLAMGT
jgi:hypothetical protein